MKTEKTGFEEELLASSSHCLSLSREKLKWTWGREMRRAGQGGEEREQDRKREGRREEKGREKERRKGREEEMREGSVVAGEGRKRDFENKETRK